MSYNQTKFKPFTDFLTQGMQNTNKNINTPSFNQNINPGGGGQNVMGGPGYGPITGQRMGAWEEGYGEGAAISGAGISGGMEFDQGLGLGSGAAGGGHLGFGGSMGGDAYDDYISEQEEQEEEEGEEEIFEEEVPYESPYTEEDYWGQWWEENPADMSYMELMNMLSGLGDNPFWGTQGGSETTAGWNQLFGDVPEGQIPPELWSQIQDILQNSQDSESMLAGLQNLFGEVSSQASASGLYGVMPEHIGGGGIGGTPAKRLSSPMQSTGFAGTGTGITSQSGSTLEDLLNMLGQ